MSFRFSGFTALCGLLLCISIRVESAQLQALAGDCEANLSSSSVSAGDLLRGFLDSVYLSADIPYAARSRMHTLVATNSLHQEHVISYLQQEAWSGNRWGDLRVSWALLDVLRAHPQPKQYLEAYSEALASIMGNLAYFIHQQPLMDVRKGLVNFEFHLQTFLSMAESSPEDARRAWRKSWERYIENQPFLELKQFRQQVENVIQEQEVSKPQDAHPLQGLLYEVACELEQQKDNSLQDLFRLHFTKICNGCCNPSRPECQRLGMISSGEMSKRKNISFELTYEFFVVLVRVSNFMAHALSDEVPYELRSLEHLIRSSFVHQPQAANCRR